MASDHRRIHGLISPHSQSPIALDLDGQRCRVVSRAIRWDLTNASYDGKSGAWFDYWDVELEDGRKLLISHDKNHNERWYLEA